MSACKVLKGGFVVWQEEDVVRRWAADINEAVNINSVRPKMLLVFLNPFGGSGRAPTVWAQDAAPILNKAGVLTDTVGSVSPTYQPAVS